VMFSVWVGVWGFGVGWGLNVCLVMFGKCCACWSFNVVSPCAIRSSSPTFFCGFCCELWWGCGIDVTLWVNVSVFARVLCRINRVPRAEAVQHIFVLALWPPAPCGICCEAVVWS